MSAAGKPPPGRPWRCRGRRSLAVAAVIGACAVGLSLVVLALVPSGSVPGSARRPQAGVAPSPAGAGKRTSSASRGYMPRDAGTGTRVAELSSGLDSPCGLSFDSSGDVWIANESANTVVAYTPSQLLLGLPGTTLSSGPSDSLGSPCGLAFDPSGDLWVANESANTVVEYTPAQLVSGAPVPAVTISSPVRSSFSAVPFSVPGPPSRPSGSLDGPVGLAFDPSGDLWVANESANTVVEYTPGQLVSGAPVPRVTIASSSLPASLDGPVGLAFDSSGDLWVANESANTVVEYTPGQLVSGDPPPSVIIGAHVPSAGSSASLSGPHDLTFDRSGNLWVANEEGDDLVELAPDQLVSGSPAPRATISSGPASGLSVPLGLAFDSSGDLWVTNEEGDDLVEYTPDQLISGSPDPRVAASAVNGGFDWPFGVAFDSSGDLWVANYSANSVVEFAPRQLTTGSPTPTVTISSGPSDSLEGPDGLAFDRSGDLWVANYDEVTGADSLVEFAPRQLATGAPVPRATISPDLSYSLDEPEGLAFDSSGDLWVANYGGNSLVEFARRQLATGSPTPAATISSGPSDSLDEPQGLAFDSVGDLWVANDNSDTVVELKPRQLVTGSPTPAVTVSSALPGSLDGPADLAFDSAGDLWVANYNSDTVVEYSPGRLATGPEVPNATISSGPSNSLDGPDGLAFEPSGDLWVVNFNNNTAVEYSLGVTTRARTAHGS